MKEVQVNKLTTLIPISLQEGHKDLITSPEAKSTTRYIFCAEINP
jgi:hypothetical protein